MTPGDSAQLAQSLNMLMSPGLINSVRREISTTEAQMLSLAYGYDLVAVPDQYFPSQQFGVISITHTTSR